MFKLLFTIGVFLMLALTLLGLRQHRLELESQTAQLRRIALAEREETLRDQQVTITQRTNPLALLDGLNKKGLDLGQVTTIEMTAGVGDRNDSHGDANRDLTAPLPRHGTTPRHH